MNAASPGARLLSATALVLLAACSGGGADDLDPQTTLTREKVAHWFSKDQLETAREALAPLVAGGDAEARDLLRAAAIEFGLSEPEAAEGFLARAEALDAEDPALWFLRGQMARESGEFEAAVENLQRANTLAPGDLPTRYVLGRVLDDLDRTEEAEAFLRGVVEVGIENGGSWYVSSLYGLERLLLLDGREEEAQVLRARREELKRAGVGELDASSSRVGTFGRIAPPEPRGSRVPAPPSSLAFASTALELPGFTDLEEVRAHDLDGDGTLDLLARTGDGVVAALRRPDGWREQRIADGRADRVVALDLDNEPDAALELLVLRGTDVAAHRLDLDLVWGPIEVTMPELPGAPSAVVPVDFDHEGDMDLLLVGDFGARLWRNDGAYRPEVDVRGAFVDTSELAGLPADRALDWATVEDLDGDNDVDLLLGGAEGALLMDSLRAGRFADVSERLPAGGLTTAPLVADLDGDGRPDLLSAGAGGQLWLQGDDGTYGAASPLPELVAPLAGVDLDLDGSLDVLHGSGALLAAGLSVAAPATLEGVTGSGSPQAVLDLDGDGALDLVQVGTGGTLEAFTASGPRGSSMPVLVRGNKSNKRGVGSIVEARAGSIYRRIYYRGEPVRVGVGPAEKLDVLRITYPNGSVLSRLDVPLSGEQLIDDPDAAFGEFSEPDSLIGSCPFLYTWNGETFEFVTDVLGITPLGLPMAPGMMVPPDHDEYVLVTGEQLVEDGGVYRMQVTEELREVTYLDRAQLIVVDHPEDAEVYPNELFSFPPFPEAHLHTVEAPSPLVRATGSDGRDWTEALAAVDDEHAIPFERELPQFQGLARPWFLELEFDAEAVRSAEELRLVMTGWFFWSDASVNMLAARTPGVDFVPPILQVPDGEGGWRDAGPPVGFPAGKTKTMLVDVRPLLDPADPRLRMFCTLQLYWDRIALATCGDDAERVLTEIEADSAVLRPRGFSAPVLTNEPGLPERFEWDRVTTQPRWDPHPGRYTRFGDVLPLLEEVDDRYIVMGTGEALELTFPSEGVPALREGWRRDYLLFLDGWAKDRDHNTLEAETVEPLPFHGMSGYPYGEDEGFPDDEEHRRWREEWQTREARPLIQPVAPGR